MKGILAVAAREVRERRTLLLAPLAFGLLPVIVPRIPTVSRLTRDPDLVLHLLAGLEVGLPAALALGLGASVLARDIGERRLGFYFSRPLPGLQIWAGKVIAVLAMLAISVVLLPLPALLLGDQDTVLRALLHVAEGRQGPPRWALPLFLIFVMALSAAVAGALRARSGLLAADILALALVTTALVWTIRALVAEGAAPAITPADPSAALAVIAAITAILLAATAAQVAVGRSDSRRGHIALSSVAWGGLGFCALAFGLYAQWILGSRPTDLRAAGVSAPSQGGGFMIRGESTRGWFHPSFLLTTSGERADRLGGRVFGEVWAPDGSRLFWIDADREELVTAWVGKTETGITRIAPNVGAERRRFMRLQAVSPDGRRLLAATSDVVLLLDSQTGAETGSAPLPGWKRGAFVAPDRVRFLVASTPQGYSAAPQLVEVDFTQGRAVELGRLDLPKPTSTGLIAVSPAFDRILVDYDWTAGGPHPGLTLHDLDGRRIATIPVRGPRDAAFLADGRIVVVDRGPEGLQLRVFTRDGSPLRAVTAMLGADLARQGWVRLNGEAAPGLVAVSLATFLLGSVRECETLFIDADTAEVRRRERGLDTAQAYLRSSRFAAPPLPGSIGTRLFQTAKRDIVWFDPTTGERRLLVDVVGETGRRTSK